MTINVNVITEITIELTLNKTQAEGLLYFLRHALTPPRVSEPPYTNIVQQFAGAMMTAGVNNV